MGDRSVLPLQLGFVGEIEKQSMEIVAGGSNPARGKKRPPSPPDGDEEPSMATPSDDDNEWIVSDNDHHENQGKILNHPLLN